MVLLVLTVPALAREARPPVSVEIASRIVAFDGREFGAAGQYERIAGVARLRIDPREPANRGIVDLALAPRAADGRVDYDVDLVILRPKDPKKARRVLLYDVVNRGMKLSSMFTGARSMVGGDPIDPGDGVLLAQGYTLVWSGWQGDIAGGGQPGGLMGARLPVARGRKGRPVTGRVAIETIFDNATGQRMALPYRPASLDPARASLTVRAKAGDAPTVLPASAWRFDGDRAILIDRPQGFDAGAIYRFEYVARDPVVMGLGFAATRDLVAFLRHGREGNPLADIFAGRREGVAIAFGASQSGRYLRDFLWQGFNRDLAGRRVFDGMIPFIAGARRTFTNARFAEPGRFSRQHEDHGVPGFGFPFAYGTLRDPVTRARDGILAACTRTGTCPKVFHIDTSAEFWQAGASLVGTGGTASDLPYPPNVRAFMIAGGAHAPGLVLPACRYPANGFTYAPGVRALLLAMVDWVADGVEPPDSRWPSVAKGELVPLEALRPPAIPGIDWPRVVNRPEAPAGRPDWTVLVPQVDADGVDLGGIRLPEVAAPAGTHLGWNLRKPGHAEGQLCLLAGTYLPFAADAASRGGDPRLSLAERYPAGGREAALRAAAEALVAQRLLLPADLPAP